MLQTFVDGELDRTQCDAVQAHLDACRRCGLEADTYRELKGALDRCRNGVRPELLARLRRFAAQLSASSGTISPPN